MWKSSRKAAESPQSSPEKASGLKDAMRQARIEAAERTAVVVDLRDAEVARLQILNDALDPVFAEIPAEIEIFDRGISKGDVPRLWIDVIAHVVMGRDKRTFRFVQDTRFGRKVIAESPEASEIATAVTRYVARRLVERERALADDGRTVGGQEAWRGKRERRQFWRSVKIFIFGLVVGIGALIAAALFAAHS